MKYDKLSHLMGTLLLGATTLFGCKKHPMLAMAEETDATGMQSSSIGSKKFGTFYAFEEPYDCAAKGNWCHERKLVPRFREIFCVPPLDLDTQKLKTTARIAEEDLNTCLEDLDLAKDRLKDRTGSLVKHEEDLKRCQEDLDHAKNWSNSLSDQLNAARNELDHSERNFGEANERYQLCLNKRSPLPAETANTEERWPIHVGPYSSAVGGAAIGGAVVGAWMWRKMSNSFAAAEAELQTSKEREERLQQTLNTSLSKLRILQSEIRVQKTKQDESQSVHMMESQVSSVTTRLGRVQPGGEG
ncbi:MAG: hypothetical protein RL012_18 [Bacteroidota bacterium]